MSGSLVAEHKPAIQEPLDLTADLRLISILACETG